MHGHDNQKVSPGNYRMIFLSLLLFLNFGEFMYEMTMQ